MSIRHFWPLFNGCLQELDSSLSAATKVFIPLQKKQLSNICSSPCVVNFTLYFIMELFKSIVSRIIDVPNEELQSFVSLFTIQEIKRNGFLSHAGKQPDEVFFIERGLVRVTIQDTKGAEHTIHFAMEGQFIADYASYLRKQPANYSIQAIEDTRVVVLSRSAIDWGYENLACGEQLGRRLAELYFSMHDDRIKMSYLHGPKDRYNQIERVYPGIFGRIPQHMIASYLGISPVHLSRIKRSI